MSPLTAAKVNGIDLHRRIRGGVLHEALQAVVEQTSGIQEGA
jgi:hypothetical protein